MIPGSNSPPLSHANAPVPGASRFPESAPRHHLGTRRPIGFGVLTTSDTHTEEDDESGSLVKRLLTEGGQRVAEYHLVANSVADIRECLDRWFANPEVEAVITIGGTGVSSRDVTIEALAGGGGKALEGFGDLYRMLSYPEVGPLAVLSRASLFSLHNRPVFAVPGSTRACQLAVRELILPTVEHLVEELAR